VALIRLGEAEDVHLRSAKYAKVNPMGGSRTGSLLRSSRSASASAAAGSGSEAGIEFLQERSLSLVTGAGTELLVNERVLVLIGRTE